MGIDDLESGIRSAGREKDWIAGEGVSIGERCPSSLCAEISDRFDGRSLTRTRECSWMFSESFGTGASMP